MKMKTKPLTFRQQCERAADEVGIEIMFFDEKGQSPRESEDDGAIHIVRRGLRACFMVGQDNPVRANRFARELMTALGMADKVAKVLVEEYDEDDALREER